MTTPKERLTAAITVAVTDYTTSIVAKTGGVSKSKALAVAVFALFIGANYSDGVLSAQEKVKVVFGDVVSLVTDPDARNQAIETFKELAERALPPKLAETTRVDANHNEAPKLAPE